MKININPYNIMMAITAIIGGILILLNYVNLGLILLVITILMGGIKEIRK